jgi:hypothetical protein
MITDKVRQIDRHGGYTADPPPREIAQFKFRVFVCILPNGAWPAIGLTAGPALQGPMDLPIRCASVARTDRSAPCPKRNRGIDDSVRKCR